MTTNYKENRLDVDYVYINANDVNYFPLESLNITGRKVVTIGQNAIGTYPVGNLGTIFNTSTSTVTTDKIDLDPVDVAAVLPTAVIYNNRSYPNQMLVRGQFNLAENYPQTNAWQVAGNADRISPTQVGSDYPWTNIFGNGFSKDLFATKTDGTLWGIGQSTNGTLAISSNTNYSSPIQINGTTWRSIACSYYHVSAIKTDGTLWAWGLNSYGQLGQSDLTRRTSPVQVGVLTNWSEVSASRNGILAIKTDGTLWGIGSGSDLGINTSTNYSTIIQIGSLSNWSKISSCSTASTVAIKTDGTLWSWGTSPVQLGVDTSWVKISTGYGTQAAIKADGSLWMWGSNIAGGLGNNSTSGTIAAPTQLLPGTQWQRISCGYRNASAIKSDGTLWVWGYNHKGQLGLSDLNNRLTPTQLGSYGNWKQVSCGYHFSHFLSNDGSLWSCGYNLYGTLGLAQNGLLPAKLTYGI